MKEIQVSRAIIERYMEHLLDSLEGDVAIVGSGPAGLTAAYYLSKNGVKTVVFEKRLSIGGGIWGGAAGYNRVVVEDREILDEVGVECEPYEDLFVADSIQFATGLAYQATRAGARVFNLVEAEDVVLIDGRIQGLVLNSTGLNMGHIPADPYMISSKFVIDTTGHEACIARMLHKKVPGFHPGEFGEGAMDVVAAEEGVVAKTGEVYSGLFLAGMSVCTFHNLPRMGPIFGGMLKSGKKAAEMILDKLG